MSACSLGSCQIFGWGHNHRGQLGGIEGAKVRMPAACESLAGLKPIQIAGGEQTLFIVTGDGKVRSCLPFIPYSALNILVIAKVLFQ